jgi:hypothetical protein
MPIQNLVTRVGGFDFVGRFGFSFSEESRPAHIYLRESRVELPGGVSNCCAIDSEQIRWGLDLLTSQNNPSSSALAKQKTLLKVYSISAANLLSSLRCLYTKACNAFVTSIYTILKVKNYSALNVGREIPKQQFIFNLYEDRKE